MLKLCKIAAASVFGLGLLGGTAMAAENISGDIGFNTNTHFISYGVDVWGAGTSFYGSRMTNSIYGDLGVKLTPDLSYGLNVWTDLNTNVPSGLGGSVQEIDINNSLTYNFGAGFTGSAAFGAWSYAGDVEDVVDLGLGYDDSGLWGGSFALSPHIAFHDRVAGNGAQKIGSAFVFSVGPSFPLWDSGFSLTIPAGLALFTTHDFQGGTAAGSGGIGYGYVGGSLATPLSFIPASYGAWSANFDLIGYFTSKEYIPGNPKADFLTGSFNIKMAF